MLIRSYDHMRVQTEKHLNVSVRIFRQTDGDNVLVCVRAER